MGSRSPHLEALAAERVPALYLLTAADSTPRPHDGRAADDASRRAVHDAFRAALEAQPAPWVELTGDREERLARATAEVDALLARGWDLAPSLEQQQHAARRTAAT